MPRLGQCDVESVITSLVEDLLPAQLKAKWSDVTLGERKVPPISKLIAFLEERADQPQYVTGFRKTGLIAGLVKIDFFPEKVSTKFKYCLHKI